MAISVFDLFKIGIGPSSSHTVGPMRAANMFVQSLREAGDFDRLGRLHVSLYGSLGATGKGHGTDKAVILGLEGEEPETVDTKVIPARIEQVMANGYLRLNGERELTFSASEDLTFHRSEVLPFHPNGMTFSAFDADGMPLMERTYYSVGGGFVLNEAAAGEDRIVEDATTLPLPFTSGAEMLARCAEEGLSISQVMLQNERVWRSEDEIMRVCCISGRSCRPVWSVVATPRVCYPAASR